jgi:HAD superfamily hydrolase (TIGR01509 family)
VEDIRVVLFDLDETLTDSSDAILAWWRGYFTEAGEPFPALAHQHLLYTLPQEEIVQAFALGEGAQAAYARYLARVGVGNTVSGVRLKPGARETLDWCKARFDLALATNRSSQLTQLLARLGIVGYFDLVVSGENAPHFKPHPWGVHHVLKRFGCAAHEVIFVGDSPHDIEFAFNGGIRSVGIGDNWKRGPLVPTWAIDDIRELPGLMQRIVPALREKVRP